jgi:hypothetical protein
MKELTILHDMIVVASKVSGLDVFLNQLIWPRVRINPDRIPYIKYIAIYVSAPISAITHYASVVNFEEIDNRYTVHFEKTQKLEIPLIKDIYVKGVAPQNVRLTNSDKLF